MIDRLKRLELFGRLKRELNKYSNPEVEAGVMNYCLHAYGYRFETKNSEIESILEKYTFPTDLETVVEFFEIMVEDETKNENGIVFTPKYIAEQIVRSTIGQLESWSDDIKIIDPGCGCGIFLVAAVEYIHEHFKVDIATILENNIFGIDIEPDNVSRCKLVLTLLCAYHGGDYTALDLNDHVVCADSLKLEWNDYFSVSGFSFVIGNPPYVNPHDMSKETVSFLKKTFSTTQSGVFNIFYAFIEHAVRFLLANGKLGYIVPNNFLSIKSATDLRHFLQVNNYLGKIIDFGCNMVFQPVRTYNCIIVLDNQRKTTFDYCVLPAVESVEQELHSLEFQSMETKSLDINGWKLVDRQTRDNLKKIECHPIHLKDFVRTGSATLRDNVYLVDKDETGYFKVVDGVKYSIEAEITKTIYKIPDLKLHANIEKAARRIIFPYVKAANGFKLMPAEELTERFPQTYRYLLTQKAVLEERDKGKGGLQEWYAYGRTQGLNKYGRKLLFPTFSNHPKFMFVNDETALFCNGYAVFENDIIPLDILQKVLNSSIMDYYVRNTSYPIEGGYFCYQKKYIERFSIPVFSEAEMELIRRCDKTELDCFLQSKYELQ